MSQESGQNLHTSATVQDYFSIESHVISTRSADGYNAVDKSRGSAIFLWLLRHPLALNSEAVKRYLGRIRRLEEIRPAVCDLLGYGVDSSGTAFSVLDRLDGAPIISGNFEASEAERRFMSLVTLVAALHEEGLVCGDLCSSSFWVDRAGSVRFVGLMGSFDTEATATAMLPPMETLHCVAPEQRSGGGVEPASDVFALGVLGYHLFVHRYPFGDEPPLISGGKDISEIPQPSSLVDSPAVWLDEVLLRCLNADPASRYRSAGELLNAISEIRQRSLDRESVPTRSASRDAAVHSDLSQGVYERSLTSTHSTDLTQGRETGLVALEQGSTKSRARVLLIGLLGVALVVVVLGFVLRDRGNSSDSSFSAIVEPHQGLVSDDLRRALDVISDSGGSYQEKVTRLEQVANSDDPVAYDVLVKLAVKAPTDSFRQLAEKAIIDRARRLRLLRGADVVKEWLDSRGVSAPPVVGYEPILRALDNTLPVEAISVSLRQAYEKAPAVGLRLAAALALDARNGQQYQQVISQLVGDSLKLADAGEHSVFALVLAQPDLAQFFADDVIQRRSEIADSDVFWLLGRLAERGDSTIRALASTALDRGLVSAKRKVFLTVLRDRGDLPTDVMQALVRGSEGSIAAGQIATFGRWYDIAVERILLAICADDYESEVLLEAFDTLSGRSLQHEPSATLVEWIRGERWTNRLEFVQAVGALANIEAASDAELEVRVQAFERYFRDWELLETLLHEGTPRLTKLMIKKYSTQLGLGRLLSLLSHSDKDVRLATIEALEDYNDVTGLRLVIAAYESEKDPEVQNAYREAFWFVRRREKMGASDKPLVEGQ